MDSEKSQLHYSKSRMNIGRVSDAGVLKGRRKKSKITLKSSRLKDRSKVRESCFEKPPSIFTAASRAIKEFPFQFWSNFIQTLLIPSYRPEWGKYVKWDHRIPPPTPLDLENRNRERHKRGSRLKKRRKKLPQKTISHTVPTPIPHDHTDCLTVRINVSGQIFETQIRTLKQFPDTLLGNPKKMMQYYDPVRDEFFFDRNRTCFEAILLFYQTGGITRQPPSTNVEMFLEEAKFFELDDIILSIEVTQGATGTEEDKLLPKNLLKRKLWLLLEYPESSYQGRIVAYCSVFVVCISIFEFCCETVPEFKWGLKEDEAHRLEGRRPTDFLGPEGMRDLKDPFFLTETLCVIFFVFELLTRAAVCPRFFAFVKDVSNIIDLVAIVPYFLSFIAHQGVDTSDTMSHDSLYGEPEDPHEDEGVGHFHQHATIAPTIERRGDDQWAKTTSSVTKATSLTILRVIRLVRVFRIFKLSRHNRGLKILGKTLRASLRELGLLTSFLLIGVIVFSSAVFLTETHSEDTEFTSIPSGFWFGIITMTTLGYGDIVPASPAGKVVGSLCAISGVLTISLPVPVIVSNFNMFYNREISKEDTEKASEFQHVSHCPFYPGWYSPTGEVVGGGGVNHANSAALTYLMGDNQEDFSDSDFDYFKKEQCLKAASRSRRHSSKKIGTTQKAGSQRQVSFT